MRSDARITACLVRAGPISASMPRDRAPAHVHAELDLGNAEMRALAAEAEIERHGERRAAADAMALDGGDGDLLDAAARPCTAWGRAAD